MAKNSVTDYDTTAANNTDVGGIAIEGSDNVANFDNALRTIMAHAKAEQTSKQSAIDDKLPLVGGTLTGNLTAPSLISSASKSDTPMSDLFIKDDGNLIGLRQSLSDDLCVDVYNSGSAVNAIKVNQEGIVLKPNQPAFSADGAAARTTSGTLVFSNAKINQGSNYNAATGVFTAPVTGKYYFKVYCLMNMSAGSSAHATLNFGVNGAGTNPVLHSSINYTRSYEPLSFSDAVSLAEGDTLYVNLALFNGATSFGSPYNSFTGFLIG